MVGNAIRMSEQQRRRLGVIGVDTSHLPEFTRRINALNDCCIGSVAAACCASSDVADNMDSSSSLIEAATRPRDLIIRITSRLLMRGPCKTSDRRGAKMVGNAKFAKLELRQYATSRGMTTIALENDGVIGRHRHNNRCA